VPFASGAGTGRSCSRYVWWTFKAGHTALELAFFSRIPVLLYLSTTVVSIGGIYFSRSTLKWCRSQWPRGLRRRSAAARLLRSWVRIPRGAWIFVCCKCRVLSGRGLCDELITRPEESYRLWCVVVCDVEPQEWGGHDPRWVAAPKQTNKTLKW
jgi:hypothetical protein